MALQYACELLVDFEDLFCDCDQPSSEEQIELVLEGASDYLSILAGMPLGRCTTTWRPCRDRPEVCYGCSCCGLYGIHLPGLEPDVTEVKINGAVVPSSQYVVMVTPAERYVLERIDSNGDSIWWPLRQKLTRPPSASDTFQITVTAGFARTEIMTMAAAEIACDVFRYIANVDNVLPPGVASAIAGGLTMSFQRFSDPTDQETLSMVGFTWVKRFLQSLPDKPAAVQVLSPELDDGWSLWQRRVVVTP